MCKNALALMTSVSLVFGAAPAAFAQVSCSDALAQVRALRSEGAAPAAIRQMKQIARYACDPQAQAQLALQQQMQQDAENQAAMQAFAGLAVGIMGGLAQSGAFSASTSNYVAPRMTTNFAPRFVPNVAPRFRAERCAARHADPTPDVCAEVGRLAHRRIRRAPDAGLRPAGPSDARRRASCGLAADAGDRVSGGLATSAGECAWRTFCRTGIAPSGRIGGRRTTSGAWRAAGGRRDAPVPCGVTRDPGHGAGGGRCAQNSRGRRRRADKRGVSRAAGMGGCDGAGRDACGRGGACGLDNGCPHRDACDRRRPIAVERRFGVGFGVGVEFSNSPRC